MSLVLMSKKECDFGQLAFISKFQCPFQVIKFDFQCSAISCLGAGLGFLNFLMPAYTGLVHSLISDISPTSI